MIRIILVPIILYAIVSMTGCASSTSVALSIDRQDKVVSMTSNINREYRVVKHVRVDQKSPLLFITRMFPGKVDPDLDEMLQPELISTQGDGVVNVKIQGETAAGDIILPISVGVLGGIAFPPLFVVLALPLFEDLKTYAVEGDIVKYTDQKRIPESKPAFDPVTGLPSDKPATVFDPATGLPMKP